MDTSETSTDGITIEKQQNNEVNYKNGISIKNLSGTLVVSLNSEIIKVRSLEIRTFNGKLVKEICLNSQLYSFPAYSLSSGAYIVGNKSVGWKNIIINR